MDRFGGVTACLVTRGDQPEKMREIRESLQAFPRVIVWDNSEQPDWKCAGRYMAETLADTQFVYWQDDDVIVPAETQRRLVADASPDYVLANYGHGENDGGYSDLPLVCGGAVAPRGMSWRAIARYAEHYILDDVFRYEADFIVGVLYEDFRHLHLPFEIDMPIAQAPERLCNQDWQADLKLLATNRARAIRDGRAAHTALAGAVA